MEVKKFTIKLVERSEIKDFIEKWHYSKSINGLRIGYCFGLYNGDDLIGAMIYGKLGMANAWKKYGQNEDDVIELRRLCCIDNTPKNTESFFIGKTLNWLLKNTRIHTVVSYADTNFGHEGTIYKASNFNYLGKTGTGRVIKRLSDNKLYHDKSIRTKNKGKLKPFAIKLKEQLNSGEAIYVNTKGKNIYVYDLKKRRGGRTPPP